MTSLSLTIQRENCQLFLIPVFMSRVHLRLCLVSKVLITNVVEWLAETTSYPTFGMSTSG